jgi:large subunit ribosomal protein L21
LLIVSDLDFRELSSPIHSHELILNLAKEDKLFSVIEVGGKQYKVTLRDIVTCDRLNGVDVGQTIPLERVLMVGGRHYTIIGQPYIGTDYFRLYATVLEQGKGPKMYIERFKRRKNYDRRIGHRQHTTTLRISAYELGIKDEPSAPTESSPSSLTTASTTLST